MASGQSRTASGRKAALRGPLIRIGLFVLLLGLALNWLLCPGHPLSPRDLLLRHAGGLAQGARVFWQDHGRYPASVEEWRSLRAGGEPLVDLVTETSRRAGCPLTEVTVPPPGAPDGAAPVLVMRGGSGRLAIYSDGRVGLSPCFVPQRNWEPPNWVLILPD